MTRRPTDSVMWGIRETGLWRWRWGEKEREKNGRKVRQSEKKKNNVCVAQILCVTCAYLTHLSLTFHPFPSLPLSPFMLIAILRLNPKAYKTFFTAPKKNLSFFVSYFFYCSKKTKSKRNNDCRNRESLFLIWLDLFCPSWRYLKTTKQ